MNTKTLGLLLLATLAGCQNLPLLHHRVREVDDTLWAYVGETDKAEVAAARDARDRALDATAVADRRIDEAKDHVTLALRERDVASARLDEAREALRVAHKQDRVEFEHEENGIARAQLWHEAAARTVDWRKLDVIAAKAQRLLARENLELAEARIELAKARAVDRLERTESRGVDLERFELQVRQHATQRQIAEIEAEAAEREVAIARDRVPELPSEADGQ